MRIKGKNFIFMVLIGVLLAIPNMQFYSHDNVIHEEKKLLAKEIKNINTEKFKDLNLLKDNIIFKLEGSEIHSKFPIYIKNNRYLIPASDFVKSLGGEYSIDKNKVQFNLVNTRIELNLAKNDFTRNNSIQKLKEAPVISGNVVYISLYDFTKMFDLKTTWNTKNKTVSLFYNKDKLNVYKAKTTNKVALIRLEDISSEDRYSTSETLEKLRIIGDYLYSKSIPFHVAWVPRYIDPKKGIDNNISKKYTMHNVDFVYTLDYLIDKNGVIGLHGYTHQYGKEVSIYGTELTKYRNTSSKEINNIVQNSIQVSKKINIPIHFFESPHYDATNAQHREIEKYFDYMYEPSKFADVNNVARRKNGNRVVKYIPTPLDYVDGRGDTNNMIRKINNLSSSTLASFFYHPNIEFEYIKLSRENNGYPTYVYNENSPLKKIINTFYNKGYKFIKITDIK